MKFLYLLPTLVLYVIAIKLPTIVSLWVLSAATVLCVLMWFFVELNPLALLSSATSGAPTASSQFALKFWVACVIGWVIGYVAVHKDLQQTLVNLVTP